MHTDQEGTLMMEVIIAGERASQHMRGEVQEGEDAWIVPVHLLTLFTQLSLQ